MARYVVAFDSSSNGMYYAVVSCDEYMFKELIDEVTRSISAPHMIETRALRRQIVKSLERMLSKGAVAICMHVDLAGVKNYIRDLSPWLSKKRREKIAYKAVGRAVLTELQKHLPRSASIATWYADRGDCEEILRLVGIENVYVDKARSSPADAVAWLNQRGAKLKGVIEVDARDLTKAYARRILRI